MSYYNNVDAVGEFYDMKEKIYRELVNVNFNLDSDGICNLTSKLHEENPEMEEEFKELLVDYFSNNLQYLDKNLLLLNSAALSILAVDAKQFPASLIYPVFDPVI